MHSCSKLLQVTVLYTCVLPECWLYPSSLTKGAKHYGHMQCLVLLRCPQAQQPDAGHNLDLNMARHEPCMIHVCVWCIVHACLSCYSVMLHMLPMWTP